MKKDMLIVKTINASNGTTNTYCTIVTEKGFRKQFEKNYRNSYVGKLLEMYLYIDSDYQIYIPDKRLTKQEEINLYNDLLRCKEFDEPLINVKRVIEFFEGKQYD